MPGTLTHAPEYILSRLLIGLNLAQDPDVGVTNWPVHYTQEPDSPDNVITIYGTDGIDDGRTMVDGERQERHGIQLKVRGNDHDTAFAKIRELAVALDEDVYSNGVVIGSTSYRVHSFSRTSGPISLGKDSVQTKLDLFTLNGTLLVREL
jgi:hypothetical protein